MTDFDLPTPESNPRDAEYLARLQDYYADWKSIPSYTKLCEAQALLRHQIPDGDLARIFERALDALLREARRTKFAATSRPPRADRADSDGLAGPASRHIPAAVRRAVAPCPESSTSVPGSGTK